MKLVYDENRDCKNCSYYMKCDMNQIGLGSGRWARECILYKKGDGNMYYCNICGGEDFVFVVNEYGEEVEQCTGCGHEYRVREDWDNEDGGDEDD